MKNWRAPISNHTFNLMGEQFSPYFDRDHFLGHGSLDFMSRERKPPARIKKNGELFILELMVPGFKKEEISVNLSDDILIVEGKKKEEIPKEKGSFILDEFETSTFRREFKLSPNVAHEKIVAEYFNGILKLTFTDVPLAEERVFQKVKIK